MEHQRSLYSEPIWDITVSDILLNGPAKAGEDMLLSAVMKNAGEAPTPEGAVIYGQFSMDA